MLLSHWAFQILQATHTHSETRTECHPWVSPLPADTSSGIHVRKAFHEPLKHLYSLPQSPHSLQLYLGSRQGRAEGLGNAHPLGAAQWLPRSVFLLEVAGQLCKPWLGHQVSLFTKIENPIFENRGDFHAIENKWKGNKAFTRLCKNVTLCVSYFSCCCVKIPNKGHLKEELSSTQGPRQPHCSRKAAGVGGSWPLCIHNQSVGKKKMVSPGAQLPSPV